MAGTSCRTRATDSADDPQLDGVTSVAATDCASSPHNSSQKLPISGAPCQRWSPHQGPSALRRAHRPPSNKHSQPLIGYAGSVPRTPASLGLRSHQRANESIGPSRQPHVTGRQPRPYRIRFVCPPPAMAGSAPWSAGPLAQPLPAPLRYQRLLKAVEVLNAVARAEHDRLKRISASWIGVPVLRTAAHRGRATAHHRQ